MFAKLFSAIIVSFVRVLTEKLNHTGGNVSLNFVNEIDDAAADLEAHVFSIGQTVVGFMSEGFSPKDAITKMADLSNESFEFVKTATISVLQEEIENR